MYIYINIFIFIHIHGNTWYIYIYHDNRYIVFPGCMTTMGVQSGVGDDGTSPTPLGQFFLCGFNQFFFFHFHKLPHPWSLAPPSRFSLYAPDDDPLVVQGAGNTIERFIMQIISECSQGRSCIQFIINLSFIPLIYCRRNNYCSDVQSSLWDSDLQFDSNCC